MSTETDTLTDEQLENEMLRPAYTFKGAELWPWSRAAKHLWQMICSSEADTTIFQVLAMLWILQKRQVIDIVAGVKIKRPAESAAEDMRRNIIPSLYGDLNQVRSDIIFWRDKLTDADEAEAMQIFEKILTAEKSSETQVSAPDGAQKKTSLTVPQTSDFTQTSSQENTVGRKTKRFSKPQ